MNTKATERFDVYQAITDQIIIAIEAGTGPVEMPWHRSEAGVTRPMNVDQDRRIHRNNLQQAAPALGTRLSRTGRLRSQSPATTARDTRRNSQPGELLLIIVSPKGGTTVAMVVTVWRRALCYHIQLTTAVAENNFDASAAFK